MGEIRLEISEISSQIQYRNSHWGSTRIVGIVWPGTDADADVYSSSVV